MTVTTNEMIKVANIWLPLSSIINQDNEKGPEFFFKEGTSPYNNLQQLALAVSCNRPVLLQGPVGSGKTCTVEYLAYITGHTLFNHKQDFKNSPLFLKVQLGEQTDARVLLGGYQCTEIPGQFVWKPGVLTQAVINGYWLLLEDIDSTSSDVVTVVDNLVKMQSLCVPGYSNNITPHKNFQLFATQRTLRYESTVAVKSIVLKQWITIQLNPLTSSEIVDIIIEKYPKLSTIASKMVSILDLDCVFSQANIRVPTVRDILKWCNRCHNYFETGSVDSALKIFHDAVDIFCGFMEKESSFQVATQIGIKLGIVKNKANFLNKSYKPNILILSEKLIAGRALLRRQTDNAAAINKLKKNYFSLTPQACCLIEKISCCLQNNEPVLLVGETGCGKTTVLQFIAQTLGRTLIVINMNQQSDTADLLGGYKPVTFKWVMKPLCEKFKALFCGLFDSKKNVDCLDKFARLLSKEKWETLINFILHVQKKAINQINNKLNKEKIEQEIDGENEILKWKKNLQDWEDLGILIKKFENQRQVAEKSLIFSFIEGSLITAMKKGYWVLLDEINLANSETLDCLSGVLEDSRGSISLIEKGENQPIFRNSGFRLFAAMNPATDIGKKQLPIGLRNRFTELYVDEIDDQNDLLPLVETYLCELNLNSNKLKKIIKFYLKVKKISKTELCDGNGRKPHYSLRNLCRALMIAAKNLCSHSTKSLYEGLCVSFLTQLDAKSNKMVHDLIIEAVTESNIKAILNQPIPKPKDNNCVNLEGFWLPVGSLRPTVSDNYILTKTVRRHFKDLIKIVSLGSGIPVLLEGDTSVGKTSLINYLAKCTGNICDRVNNHEHTDIQEYIGTYVADPHGKLVFEEGILCEAMRKGHWLILDELNLAPTEVLEALNRVLDDNRELFIPETQKTIKAHEKFLLFATQNPPGLYGGRKELSRAFRNRFIQLQFNQIPADELVTILEKRCKLPLNYSKKMVSVMTELQLRRRGSDLFIGKSGYITLRDLFRWGERYQAAKVEAKFYDWEQHLADEGFILLGGRVRLQEEISVIQEVIKKHFKRITNTENLFSLHENTSEVTKKILIELINHSQKDKEFQHIVWTYSMRRLAVLVCKALDFSEPVLIVGETGCGKTSVVQLIAKIKNKKLYSINCHMHSESADFLGGLRPVRNEARAEGKLFEWCDGPLIQAMTTGSFFLADEISLADDSVLERLNSLLEPERTILLSEKGGGLLEKKNEEYVTVANENFQFIGTMNPGGDYGKKELSPALRNRFTEIWANNFNKFECFFEIIKHNLNQPLEKCCQIASIMTSFLKWLNKTDFGKKIVISFRDVLTWVNFMNLSTLEWYESCVHGIELAFLDGLKLDSGFLTGCNLIKKFKRDCVDFLVNEIKKVESKFTFEVNNFTDKIGEIIVDNEKVGISPFFIKKGKWLTNHDKYIFNAPTTFLNAKRLFRGLIMNKGILLEGSPGVGKTSLVSSLAALAGYKLTRINLSDQTDISDLFGSDLPEEGEKAGYFIWRDGPFLTALKEGHWILLDELNLASQSVLEGLNAVLDHRGSVFIPQLNKTFYVSQGTRLFGCQNPFKEGGNRRGLPKSFLNRFIQVYAESLTRNDYVIILKNMFPLLAKLKIKENLILEAMVDFNDTVLQEISKSNIGIKGGPWEFNLRDITRWVEGFLNDISPDEANITKTLSSNIEERRGPITRSLFKYMSLIYMNRFPTKKDRYKIYEIFVSFFGENNFFSEKAQFFSFPKFFVLGENLVRVNDSYFFGDLNEFEMLVNPENFYINKQKSVKSEIFKICSTYRGKQKLEKLRLLEKQYPVLCSLSQCINLNWFVILVGESGVGKTNCIKTLAALKNENLRVMTCNSAMDTSEILGGFEQTDYNRHFDSITETARIAILSAARRHINEGKEETCLDLLKKWLKLKELSPAKDDSMSSAFEALKMKLDFLVKVLKKEEVQRYEDLKKLSDDLIHQLQSLKMQISSSDCLTLGGKFEWVDSLLVKSLKDGSWLLIEDVNLCSNAVLDRLNCLFEPQGSLTLGERGAGPDGQMYTVTPHPNFRCFFTMDPKNGSISRAMRNRGVEIYLPNEEIYNWSRLDLLSLLNDVGIDNMEIHNALIEAELNKDEQNVCSLISNGFWMAQYIKHGFPTSEAFKKSYEHVYKFTDVLKVQMIEEMSQTLDKTEKQKYCLLLARPPLNIFLMDPTYARLKQTAALIYLSAEIIRNRSDVNICFPNNVLKYFFGLTFSKDSMPTILEIVKYNILHVFLTTSEESIILFIEYLTKLLSDSKDRELKTFVISIIDKIRFGVLKTNSGFFPWDLRWFLNVHQFFGQDSDNSNKCLLLVKYLHNFRPKKATAKNGITVEQYSNYVQEGKTEDIFYNQPIVSKFNKYLKDFDDLIEDTLRCDEVKVTEEEATWFLNIMKWRFRLGNLGNLILLSGKKKSVNEDTLTLLELHLFWFLDFIVFRRKQISLNAFQTLPDFLRQRYTTYYQASTEIKSLENSSKLIKMCNTFRKHFGHPSPKKYNSFDKEIELMEVTTEESSTSCLLQGDLTILRKIFYTLSIYFDVKLKTKETESDFNFSHFSKYLCLLNKLEKKLEFVAPYAKVIEEFNRSNSKEKEKIFSEITYFYLKIMNSTYAFEDEINEVSQNLYIQQVLPFHRPVLTCRILISIFDTTNAWNLSTFRKSQNELTDILETLLPNVVQPFDEISEEFLFDLNKNECFRINVELNRILNCIKKCFGIESDEEIVKGVPIDLIERSSIGVEKIFYTRLDMILKILTKFKGKECSEFQLLGCYWTTLGLLGLLVLREGKLDPIRKKLIKADYVMKEVTELESEILALKMYSILTGANENHFYARNLREQLEESRGQVNRYKDYERIERNPKTFRELGQEVESYMTTFDEIFRFILTVWEKIFLDNDVSMAQHLYRRGRFIVFRTKKFSEELETKFATHFGDLVYPILAVSAQIEHGINLIMSELLRYPYHRFSELESLICDMCSFPIKFGTELSSRFEKLNTTFWPKQTLKLFENNKILILFSICLEKYNEWLFSKSDHTFNELIGIFSLVVQFWKEEEEKKLKEKMEKESLYIHKGSENSNITPEEIELIEDQLKLFPTFEEDFAEDSSKNTQKTVSQISVLNDEQLFEVSKMHMKIIKEFVKTTWSCEKTENLSSDLVSPICMRFSLLWKILPTVSYLLDWKTDQKMTPGLLVLTNAKLNKTFTSEPKLLREPKEGYDFYQDTNIEEVIKCIEILNYLQMKVKEFLIEWPEHPALVQVNKIINRILTFSIESPVMRFLNGLELVLQSAQKWESVAHSGVSLADDLVKITNLIIEWRKLELQGWQNCLKTAHERIKKNTFKWWFHFWCVISQYLSQPDLENQNSDSRLNELLTTLYNFIETSPLGEFDSRLEILYCYHFHVCRQPPSKKRDVLAISLWNLHAFYQQFKEEVSKKLNEDSAQISKKLKEFVKIAKWHDITYWSVKETIEKSHRTLMKFIKEYEVLLKEKIDLKSLNPFREDKSEKMRKKPIHIDISKYLVNSENIRQVLLNSSENFLMKNLNKKFEKMKKFCNEIILCAEYPNLILGLEDLSKDICENTEYFGSLDVDRSLPMEKQKSQAKNIVQQKRRVLADLFKTLQQIGLSYRMGLMDKTFGVLDICDDLPMNYEEKERLSGEAYYLKTIFRRFVLENSLLTPSQEIGPQVIERLRGYSSHFMALNKGQKITLNEAKIELDQLFHFQSILESLTKSPAYLIPNQKLFLEKLKHFSTAISQTSYILEQFKEILDSWPSSNSEKMKEMNFIADISTPSILMSSKTDDHYINIRMQYQEICLKVSHLKNQIQKKLPLQLYYYIKYYNNEKKIRENSFQFYTLENVINYNELVKDYKDVGIILNEFLKNWDNSHVKSGLTDCLHEIKIWTNSINFYPVHDNNEKTEEIGENFEFLVDFNKNIEILIENILLSIQRLIKKYKSHQEQEENFKTQLNRESEEDVEERFIELLDNHLDKKLIHNLQSDLKDLNMTFINNLIMSSLFDNLSASTNSNYLIIPEKYFRLFSTTLEFVKRYSLLCSYFVNQQSLCYRSSNKLASILLGTFIQVAQKGYCAPPEYEDDDNGDGEGWNDKEGGGFTGGEGDGQKDVSDRIESEDQLEDAQPIGSEKDKNTNKDCKEEEKGIEMSENFDGKIQELDEQDEKDSDVGSEENENPDSEMGSTEAGADKLESEMWSDSEEEDHEKDPAEEEKGSGKEINKDKYAAKSDSDDDMEGETGDGKEKKEKNKEINEMKEPEDNGDQIDPYHGHHPPEPEPEPLDLPEDMQLDEGEEKKDVQEEENPFNIDLMKEKQPPTEVEEDEKKENEKQNKSDESDVSDEEDERNTMSLQNEEMEVDEKEENNEDIKENMENENKKTEKNEEDLEEKDENFQEEFHPSDDKPSSVPTQPAPEMNSCEPSSSDQVIGNEEKKPNTAQPQEIPQNSDNEPKGTGQAEIEQMKQGHDSNASKKEKFSAGHSLMEKQRKRERPGKSDDDRCLGEAESRVNKKLKTLDKLKEEEKEEKDSNGRQDEESEIYQHVSEKIQDAAQVLDAATQEQAENQAFPNKENEEGNELEEENVAMDIDEEEVEIESPEQRKPSELDTSKTSGNKNANEGDSLSEDVRKEVEGEIVQTMTAERAPETTFHTVLPALADQSIPPLRPDEIQALRLEINQQLLNLNKGKRTSDKQAEAWQLLTSVVDGLARDLSEQLRLILEPSQATRLKGDYRTGKRINMRKVISYIASEFRKDRIWLRRTKPWKREHEIVLAIDDSSSMADNECKELAFESLALVFKALGLIEAGQLGVLSFGEKTKIVHKLGDPFTDENGLRLLEEITFEQKQTLISEMLSVSTTMMTSEKKKGDVARLLLIVSDGRGVFTEGLETIKAAVRRATDCGIFVVFLIIDNPKSKDSIMDIRVPEFKDGKLMGLQPYMELFPFPFYLILRDISALPNTLSDALRQWFELTISSSSA